MSENGLDLSTKEGALRFCELGRAEMRGDWARHGKFEVDGSSFVAFVFGTRHKGKKLDRVEAMVCRMPSSLLDVVPPEHHTEIFSRALRGFSRITQSIGSVIMSETWMVHVQGTTCADAATERAKLPRSLEHAPGRTEALVCLLEHRAAGCRVWFAEISRNPTHLGPWTEKDWPDPEGRLVDVTAWKS